MLKIFVSALCCVTFGYTFEIEVDAATGAFYTAAQGKLVYAKETWKDSYAKIDHQNRATFYGWVDLRTSYRFLPKLHMAYSHADTQGKSRIHIDSNVDLLNGLIDAIENNIGIRINDTFYESRLVQNTYEGYLYYDLLPGRNIAFDVGIGLKKFDFSYSATIVDGLVFNDSGGESVPMSYMRFCYDFDREKDLSQFGVVSSVKIFLFGDSDIYEYIVKARYVWRYNERSDVGVEFGYKAEIYDIQGDDIETVGGDMSNTGIFVGLVGRFR